MSIPKTIGDPLIPALLLLRYREFMVVTGSFANEPVQRDKVTACPPRINKYDSKVILLAAKNLVHVRETSFRHPINVYRTTVS